MVACKDGPGYWHAVGDDPYTETSCSECGKGYACPGDGTREGCAIGAYQESATSATGTCDLCPRGKYGPKEFATAATDCIECDSGRFNSAKGEGQAYACVQCAPGRSNPLAAQTAESACKSCSLGKHAPISGSVDCPACSAGKFSAKNGSFTCELCDPGYWCDEGSNSAKPVTGKCPPKTNSPRGSTKKSECVKEKAPTCGFGSFTNSTGSCEKCAAGTANNVADGETMCVLCPPGSFSTAGSRSCTPCPENTFNGNFGGTQPSACKPCFLNKYQICRPGAAVAITVEQSRMLDDADASQTKVTQSTSTATVRSTGRQMLLDFGMPGSAAPTIAYAALGVVSFLLICLHGFVPKALYSLPMVDIFSMNHSAKEGTSIVKRKSPLGFAFTLAYVPIAAIIMVGLGVSNRPDETRSLQTFHDMPATVGYVALRVTLPLESSGGLEEVVSCPNVTMATAVTGLNCKPPQQVGFDKRTCTFTGTDCTFGLDTVFTVSVPWNQRWVKWEVTTESAKPGDRQTLSGAVVSASPEKVLRGTTRVDIQAMASYYNNNVSDARGVTTTGYEIYPLPYNRPTTGLINATSATTDNWTLEIKLRRAELVNMVRTSRPLSQFQYLSLSLTTVLSFLGVWRQVFRFTEKIIEKASRKWRKCRSKCKAKRVGKKANGQKKKGGSGGSGAELEAKSGDADLVNGVELQGTLHSRVKRTSTALEVRDAGTANDAEFDEARSSSVVSPVDVCVSGDDAQRTTRLEKRADEAEAREGKANMRADEMKACVDEMKSCVDVTAKRAAEAELIAQQLGSRMLEMERKLEQAAATTDSTPSAV